MFDITFHPSNSDQNETKPLVIIFGFLNSNKKIMEKYCKIWEGCDVFVHVPPLDFSTILLRIEIKSLIKKMHKLLYKNNKITPRTIYLHGISVGTCYVGTLIKSLNSFEKGKCSYILPMIKSIVLDSGMIINETEIFRGLTKTMKKKGGLGYILALIFPVFKSKWRFYCQNDFPHFLSNDYGWNYLVISGEYDDFFPNTSDVFVELFKNSVKNSNRLIERKTFDSKHALHFKNHPEEYKKTINNFIGLGNCL
ncbi:hypothetical protein ACTFIZ_003727 [Dictyostelium cf. discoideum]